MTDVVAKISARVLAPLGSKASQEVVARAFEESGALRNARRIDARVFVSRLSGLAPTSIIHAESPPGAAHRDVWTIVVLDDHPLALGGIAARLRNGEPAFFIFSECEHDWRASPHRRSCAVCGKSEEARDGA